MWISDNNGTSTFSFSLIDDPKNGGNDETYYKQLTTTYIVAQRATAEWISEAPQSNGAKQPLANFATVTFTGAWAQVGSACGPIDAFQNPTAINMRLTPRAEGER